MNAIEIAAQLASYYASNIPADGGEKIQSIRLAEGQGDVIEVVYTRPEVNFLLGLRIRVYPENDDEVARIVVDNLSEPLGSFIEEVEVDAAGVRWWRGVPAVWWQSDR